MVDDIPGMLLEDESAIFIENSEKSLLAIEPIVKYVEKHSTMELTCSNETISLIVWKKSDMPGDNFQVVSYAAYFENGFSKTNSNNLILQDDGTLLVHEIESHQEGLYGCIYENYYTGGIVVYELIVYGQPTDEKSSTSKIRLLWLMMIIIPLCMFFIVLWRLHIRRGKQRKKRRIRNNFHQGEGTPMISQITTQVETPSDLKSDFIRQLKTKYKYQYDAVQPIPYIRDRLYCVDRVFVEGGFEKLISKTNIEGLGNWEKIASYHDVTNISSSSTRTIIEGDPGYGKSTLTLQVAYDWCNCTVTSPLADVDILILLRLRQLGGVHSVFRAIKQFILPRDSQLSETEIQNILQQSKSTVFILDGFDEYPEEEKEDLNDIISTIRGEMFQENFVILTSRSFFLPKSYPPQSHRIRLTGFDSNARDAYIRKAVVGDDTKAAEKIKRSLQKNSVLQGLCQVPLFFVMFAHMTHESERFLKFKSVTSFFQYMITCFHSHMKNKMEDRNVKKIALYENDHASLDKVAFEGLSGKNQQIVWKKEDLIQRLGSEFYNQYRSIGILVEEEILDMTDRPGDIQYKTEVRFYHKLFCEWYAAYYLCREVVKHDTNLPKLLEYMNPFDLQYTYRFACGLNPDAGNKIIEYLRGIKDGDKFAVLCILEQSGNFDQIKETVQDLCSNYITIDNTDSLLLQGSIVQLLEIGSSNQRHVLLSDLSNGLKVDLQTESPKGVFMSYTITFTERNLTYVSFKEEHLWLTIHGLQRISSKVTFPSYMCVVQSRCLQAKKNLLKTLMKRKYNELTSAVQVIPSDSENLLPVNEFFVNCQLQCMVTKDKGKSSQQWEPMDSYLAIFTDSPSQCKRYVLEGKPGYGKSMLALRMSYDWCESITQSPLSGFDMFLLVQFTPGNISKSIYTELKRCVLPRDSPLSDIDIRSVLRECTSAVMVLDGLEFYAYEQIDEKRDVRQIIRGKMFKDIDVITACSFVPEDCAPGTNRIQLMGFDNGARDEYFRKMKLVDEEIGGEKIKQKLRDNPVFRNFINVPLFFTMFAHMSQKSNDFCVTKTYESAFTWLIECLHNHMKNQGNDYKGDEHFTIEKTNLGKVAFECLCGNDRPFVLEKDHIRKVLGRERFEQYLSLGIFLEGDIVKKSEKVKISSNRHRREVTFYHELFGKWYAAQYIAKHATGKESEQIATVLTRLSKDNLQHLYNFVGELNTAAIGSILRLIKGRKDYIQLSKLIILENIDDAGSIRDILKEVCATAFDFTTDQEEPLQASMIHLLKIASKAKTKRKAKEDEKETSPGGVHLTEIHSLSSFMYPAKETAMTSRMLGQQEDPQTDLKSDFIRQLKTKYKYQYDAVQPIPYIRDRLYCVDRVFVEGGFEKLISKTTIEGLGHWEKMASYHVVTNLSSSSTRTIIEGDPGYGKSTLTLQLVYDWCNCNVTSPLADVDILILLRLRQLGGVHSVFRAIKQFILPRDSQLSEKEIQNILQQSKSTVFILDGFDEYPEEETEDINDIINTIRGEMFQENFVILTSRSFFLPKSYPPQTHRIRLTGFDSNARDAYIRKAVVDDDKKSAEKIKRSLQKNSVLQGLCQVPLFFVMFAHMTHESEKFLRFKSVTSFFRYMITCFHSHMKNKMNDRNVKKIDLHENNHASLDKVAFEGLSGKNQQIVWKKEDLIKRLGSEFYIQYRSIGILVEEEILDITDRSGDIQYKTDVRFYHKLFCEWYAAHYLCREVVKHDTNLPKLLEYMNPFDLQYTYRFACGLNADAGNKIIEHLRGIKDGDKFAVLCILEQSGNFDQIKETVQDLCSNYITIDNTDSLLLQASIVQLLEIGSSNEIPVSFVWLKECFNSVDLSAGSILLKSELSIPALSTLTELVIGDRGRKFTNEELSNVITYSTMCSGLKSLRFCYLLMPQSIKKTLCSSLQTRKIQVFWCTDEGDFLLSHQSGKWEAYGTRSSKSFFEGNIPAKRNLLKTLMKRKYKELTSAVQVIPSDSENLLPVNDFFVNCQLQCMVTKDKDNSNQQWEPMDSYQAIFTDSPSKCKRYVLKGNPGYGKSMLALRMAYDWCEGITQSPLSEFNLFLLVQFTPGNISKSIYTKIKRCVLPRDSPLSDNDIRSVLLECTSAVMVLDGLDFYDYEQIDEKCDVRQIIRGKMFKDIEVITTCSFVPEDCAPGTNRIQLMGFGNGARDEYIRKVKLVDEETGGEKVKQELREHPVLKDFINVPLFFTMFALMSKEHNDFCEPKTYESSFTWLIECLHRHMKNQGNDYKGDKHFTTEKTDLDKVAFEGLCRNDRPFVFERDHICKVLGRKRFEQYLRLGIFLHGDIVKESKGVRRNSNQNQREVKFYHELFSKWYAARYIANYATGKDSEKIATVLTRLSKANLRHIYNFVGELNVDAVGSILRLVKSRNDYVQLSQLIVFENNDDVGRFTDIVEEVCPTEFEFTHNQEEPLQAAVIHLLKIASKAKISISCVSLYNCYSTVDLRGGNHLQLKSNLSIPVLTTLNRLTIREDGREITPEEFTGILQYSSKCLALKELWFCHCLLPASVQAESVSVLRSRNVEVIWWPRGCDGAWYQLNLQSCLWECVTGSFRQ
ncbi:NLR family CARD domain-containing protein 4 [Holothuria leucospilota]|uniref:NLR family CARD domain-containing protein 4 n=1 Tax=Holothuria leucospilota TaxID=206669 RepID=A0A9Q1CQA6_HOLLE|nr:NLR family CARD domain-containing protein 4 [Holothuria leucospilota]